jgi:hypothetical protein
MFGFGFENSRAFLRQFCRHASFPLLAHFSFGEVVIQDTDLALFITTHKTTVHSVCLDNVDLYGGWDDLAKDMAKSCGMEIGKEFRTPWSTAFEALQQTEDQCSIGIEKPMQFGDEVTSELYDYDEFPGCERFWGTRLGLVPDADIMDDGYDTDPADYHVSIHVSRDQNWKKGL